MKTAHTSVAVLGACAAVLAMLLAPRPSRAANRADRAVAMAHAAHAGVLALLPPRGVPTAAVAVALCADCAASHALVRVLLRRRQHGAAVRPMLVIVDRRWPRLDTLLQQVSGSQLHEHPSMHTRIGITPVALAMGSRERSTRDGDSLTVGVPAVAALLAPLVPSFPRSHVRRIR